MTSMSLFDNMEFPLQTENYLDETFGLSAEILAADLNTDGSILDFGHGFSDGLKPQNQVSTLMGPEDPISDLFQDSFGGSFGEEWMENVDLSVFLEPDGSVPIASVEPILKEEPVPQKQNAETVPLKQKPETNKTDVKNKAFELLKSLLTGAISEKTLLAGPISLTEVPMQTQTPASPEAQVPEINFPQDLLSHIETYNEPSESCVTQIIVKPEDKDSTSVIDISNLDLASPISTDDLDSFLSSGPSTPDDSSFQTVDTSQLDDSFTTTSVDSSFDQDVEAEIVYIKESKRKSKKQKSRSSPYDSDDGLFLNKKDRKKMQNKNAATRYRIKKRQEKETMQTQENSLYDKNRELREKVDSLQREIAYMKELMNEIYKAKGVKQKIV